MGAKNLIWVRVSSSCTPNFHMIDMKKGGFGTHANQLHEDAIMSTTIWHQERHSWPQKKLIYFHVAIKQSLKLVQVTSLYVLETKSEKIASTLFGWHFDGLPNAQLSTIQTVRFVFISLTIAGLLPTSLSSYICKNNEIFLLLWNKQFDFRQGWVNECVK